MKLLLSLIFLFSFTNIKVFANEEFCVFEDGRNIEFSKSSSSDGGIALTLQFPPHEETGELYSVRIVYGYNEKDIIAFDAESKKYKDGYRTTLIVPKNYKKVQIEAIYHFDKECNVLLTKTIEQE